MSSFKGISLARRIPNLTSNPSLFLKSVVDERYIGCESGFKKRIDVINDPNQNKKSILCIVIKHVEL